MNPINSIKSRLNSRKKLKASCYWEYAEFYKDGVILEDTFFFESFGGVNFQGNPYYMFKEVFFNKDYKDYKIIIAHKNPEELKEDLSSRGMCDERVSIVKTGTREYRYAVSHAKYIVNNMSFPMDFIKKEGQVYLNTWHGTPLKTLGRSVKGDPFACINAQRNFLMCDYLIAPNQLTKEVYEKEHMVTGLMKGELYLGGYPRNSVFFDEQRRKAVKEKYNLEQVKSVFYMPTWRGGFNGIGKVDQISEIERLAKELGEGYKVFVKFHPAMQNASTKFEHCYPMPSGIEVYEFLNAIDILITDYSSVFFDFASTKKKIILYQYDKEEYFKDRGVYKEADENLQFDIAYTYEELYNFVTSDKEQKYPEFIERFCKYDSIFGAKEAVEKMLSKKQEKVVDPVNLYLINHPVTEEEIFALQDKLKGENFRLVFVLDGYSGKITRWEEIEYSSLNVYDRLTPKERRKVKRLKIAKLFGSRKALNKLKELGKRERKRIWGNLEISHIYTKNKKLPIAVRYEAEPWPKGL